MLYFIVKHLCRIAFRVFFRKIYIHRQEPLPKKRPVIYAVNHPTAFLDPVLVGTFQGPVVNFIVRGDIFNNKLIRTILANLRMYPIFRFRDGYANLKNNQAIMEMLDRKIGEGQNILILAEGETKHEKRMRPIQKGAARMAFGAYENHGDLDLQVIPVGVNYTDSDKFRSEVMIEYGKAIPLRDYYELHKENPRKAIKKLTDDLSKAMHALIIHIQDEKDDEWVNPLLDIQRNDHLKASLPSLKHDVTQLRREYALVERINEMEGPEKAKIREKVMDYVSALQKHDLQDIGLAKFKKIGFGTLLFLILGFPVFLPGFLLNCLPMYWASNLADKKVKKIEFHSSVRYGVGLVGYFLYWLILLIIVLSVGNAWWIGGVLLLPFLGFFALLYRDMFLQWNAVNKVKKLKKETQSELLLKRKTITETSGF